MQIKKKYSNKYSVFCEWGKSGMNLGISEVDVTIIVDVLSFSTCVDIVISQGSEVYPYLYKDSTALDYSKKLKAYLAGARNAGEYTLSPKSLINIKKGSKLVLPSPNGSVLTMSATSKFVLTGCLRNCVAVAHAAQRLGHYIAIIPAGELWPDGSFRVAYEDLIGAGSIIHHMKGNKSLEANYAEEIFLISQRNNFKDIYLLRSAIELINCGFSCDVDIASIYNISNYVPFYQEGRYISY